MWELLFITDRRGGHPGFPWGGGGGAERGQGVVVVEGYFTTSRWG